MQVYWTGPGIPRQLIPNSALVDGSSGLTATFKTQRSADQSVVMDEKPTSVKAYADPFVDRFKIQFYNASATNDITISVRDFTGKTV